MPPLRPIAERRGDALMRHIEVAMHDLVRLGRREEFLHQRLYRLLARQVGVRLRRIGRKHGAPQARRSVSRHLEAVAPGARVGEVAARAVAALLFEVVGRGEDDESLRPGEAVERDAALLAHDAAATVGADQIGAGVALDAVGAAHLDAHCVTALRHADDFVAEQHLHVAEAPQPFQQKLRGLELLALNHERVAGIVLEHGMVEFGDQLAARPVPELEDRGDETDARHVVVQLILLEQIERRRMGGGGAWIGLQLAVVVAHQHRQAAPSEQPGAQQPDRAAPRDQHALVARPHR
jgi:hypothetical protein